MGEKVVDHLGIVPDAEPGGVVYRALSTRIDPLLVEHSPDVSRADYLEACARAATGYAAYSAWMAGHPALSGWWSSLSGSAQQGHWLAQQAR